MKKNTFFTAMPVLAAALLWSQLAQSAVSVTRYEETSPAITYSAGSWIPETTMGWSGGSAMYTVYSPPMRAQATFTFTGSGVNWIGYRGRYGGIVVVSLDGALPVLIDTYSATEQVSVVVYSATNLPPGNHSLTIELTAARNPLAINSETAVDAFD